ncbi:hypothetical protein J2T26_000576 [Citrobacter farmeri]|nr:hypothetical protein [Citrobacter farmeri]MCW2421599.1 hypothetical protein [Citrobacter farmeri]
MRIFFLSLISCLLPSTVKSITRIHGFTVLRVLLPTCCARIVHQHAADQITQAFQV